MIDTFSATRDELIVHINDLEEEIQELETRVEDQKSEIENLPSLAPVQLERLEEAAKRRWIDGW